MAIRQEIKNELVNRCESCYQYLLSNPVETNGSLKKEFDLFEDGIKCSFNIKKWGMYQVITGNSYFKNDTVKKSYLIGKSNKNEAVALYMCDFGEELKVSGTAKIIGGMYLPKKRFKTINILGNLQENKPMVRGSIKVASQKLPDISINTLTRYGNYKELTLDDIKKQNISFNSFRSNTILIYMARGESINNIHLKGNFILKSTDTLYISKENKLEDIVIQAPKVVVEEEFQGSLQIQADKEIDIRENVTLKYPSVLFIDKSVRDYEKKISLGDNSIVYGGMVLNASSFREKQNNYMYLEENASVVGDVYCNGILEHKGNVTGSVYTHKLQLQTKSAKYADVILNGTIDASTLPDFFVKLPLFKEKNNYSFERVKSIQ